MASVKIYEKQLYEEENRNGRPTYAITPFRIERVPHLLYQCLKREYHHNPRIPEFISNEDFEKRSVIRVDKKKYWPQLSINGFNYYNRLCRYFLPKACKWAARPLRISNVYGPRTYKKTSVLLNHTDWKDTHVISISLTIDYVLNSPWTLTLDINKKIYEINLEPGEMLFYEGARTPHARPYKMDGEYYGNIYFHYYPINEE